MRTLKATVGPVIANPNLRRVELAWVGSDTAYGKTLNPSIASARIDGSHVQRNFIRKVGGHNDYTCMGAADTR